MRSFKLPRELIDMIIDHLYYDRATLAACCLVCKEWLPSSRFHLLSDLRIDYLSLTTDRLAHAQKLSVANHVQRLMICHLFPLPAGLEMFSSISALYVNGCEPYPEMRRLLPSLSQRITYVEFNNIKFHDFAEMIEFSCCFPRLETLNLSSTWEIANEPRSDLRLPSTLNTLNIQYGLLALLPWLAETMPSNLSTLRLFRLSPKHISHLTNALHSSAKSLTRLELGLHAFLEADPFIGKVNFRANTKLKSLVLHNAPLILFRSVLQSAMEHTMLREAHLITGYDIRIPPAQHAIWSTLDHHIADSSLNHHLTNLTFRLDVSNDEFRDRIIKEIKTCLPSSTGHGIIKFVSEKERVAELRSRMTGPISSRTWGDNLVF